MKKFHKKGFAVGDMLPLAITVVIVGIALALGLTMMSDFKTDFVTDNLGANCGQNSTGGSVGISYTACGDGYNGTQKAIDGLNKFTTYLPTIALVVVIAVVIGILVKYLAGRQ